MMDIDKLKQLLFDDRIHICLGIVKKLYLAEDRSYLKASVSVLPENREIIATVTWDSTGPNAGDFDFPDPEDLVLIAQAEGDDNDAYIIRRLTSKIDKIPEEATTGDKVHKAKVGKKYWNESDTNIYLSRSGTAPTENMVLGQRFKSTYSTHLDEVVSALEKLETQITKVAAHVHFAFGVPTSAPSNAAEMTAIKDQITTIRENLIDLKAEKVTNDFILSDLSFTEK